jgi:telomere length regulation protein
MHVFVLGRSSHHTHGISNRLAASSSRARFLGMVAGMAMSELIDKPEHRMKFDIDDLETDEAKWYRQLIHVDDQVGDMTDLKRCWVENRLETSAMKSRIPQPISSLALQPTVPPQKKKATQTKGALKIVEISDSNDTEDFQPYAKPDSDPEDESEDPTLVNRDRPKPPV